jgi:hypothetical protein
MTTQYENRDAAFLERISEILMKPPTTGQFSECYELPNGTTANHRFSLAVGIGYQRDHRQYKTQLGELPNWVSMLHPFHRRCLCQLALAQAHPLPEKFPVELYRRGLS